MNPEESTTVPEQSTDTDTTPVTEQPADSPTDLPADESTQTDSTTTDTDLYADYTTQTVMVDEQQFQTLVDISQRTDLLTNRIEVMLLLFIFTIAIFIFQLFRRKVQ